MESLLIKESFGAQAHPSEEFLWRVSRLLWSLPLRSDFAWDLCPAGLM
jgi:hypothetical protein